MSQSIIILSGVGTAGLTTISDLSQGRPPRPRIIIGAGVATLILSVIAIGQPRLAAMFALLLLTTAVLLHGVPVAAGLARVLDR